MPASSSGATGNIVSGLTTDPVSVSKELYKNSTSRRGSAASWLHPLSSTEVIDAVLPHNPLFPRHKPRSGSVEDALNGIATAGSLSLLSATETSPFQARERNGSKSRCDSLSIASGSKQETSSYRGYMRLAGLLTRRSRKKSRRSLAPSGAVSSRTRSSGSRSQGTVPETSDQTTARNTLQPPDSNDGDGVVYRELRLDDGGDNWPSSLLPSAIPMSSGRRNDSPTCAAGAPRRVSSTNSTLPSGTRRQLSVSPLVLPSSRVTETPELRRDNAGTATATAAALDRSEAQFIPLGSTYLGNQNGSPSRLQQSYNSGMCDEKVSGSDFLRRRHQGYKPISGSSLSQSTSQSAEPMSSTRTLQGHTPRRAGDSEISAHTLMNPRSVRDAKIALLRATQHLNACSLRSSRTHSFRRSHSNSICGVERMSQRSIKPRRCSGEKQVESAVTGGFAGGGRDMSPSSAAVINEEMMLVGLPLTNVDSPPASSGMVFLTAATSRNPSSGMREPSVSTSEQRLRYSRPEDNPLLEVMETSSCASQVGDNNAFWLPSVTERITTNHNDGASRCESPFQPSSSTRCGVFRPPRMPIGFYSLSRTGGYGSSSDNEEEDRLLEQHRNRVDEVLRQLNGTMRSTTVDDKAAALTAPSTSTGPSVRDSTFRADLSQVENNCTSGWSGIGVSDWGGGLAAFGTNTASSGNGNMSSTVNANGGGGGGGGGGWDGGGGWLGVGGAVSSEDWYSRMRQKAEEDERAEAAAVAASVITEDVTSSSSTTSNTLVPAHIPSVTITTHRRMPTQTEAHMPAINHTREAKGSLPVITSKARLGCTVESSPLGSSPSVMPKVFSPTMFPSIQPLTGSVLASAADPSELPLQPADAARMQLSHTCAALSSTGDAEHDTSAQDLCCSPPQPCAATLVMPSRAFYDTEASRTTRSLDCGVSEPRHHRDDVVSVGDCTSETGDAPASITPTEPPSTQPPHNIASYPHRIPDAVPTGYHGLNFKRRFSALGAPPASANSAQMNPTPPGRCVHKGSPLPASSRVRSSIRLSLVPPGSARVVSSSAREVAPARDVLLANVGAAGCSSASPDAQGNIGLRRNPSAPAGQLKVVFGRGPPQGLRAVKGSPATGVPAKVLTSARRFL